MRMTMKFYFGIALLSVVGVRTEMDHDELVLQLRAEIEEKDAVIRALHTTLMRRREAQVAGRRLDDHPWSTECLDSDAWHKMGEEDKTCDWVSELHMKRCGFDWGNAGTRGYDGTFALESCPASCGECPEPTYSADEVSAFVYAELTDQIAFQDFVAHTPEVDQTVERVQNNGLAMFFDSAAGWEVYNSYNPEPQFYLANAGDDSLVRDMQGPVFQFPNNSNAPSDVVFDLPEAPAYAEPSDLYYMPILSIASLIKNEVVSCVEVVQAFIDRLEEFDPYLGIVATPLYDTALATAASHDELLASGTYVGPLMCIPFG